LLIGPVFERELAIAPRRARLFIQRTAYAGVLFAVMCTAWLVLTGTQLLSNIGDMAKFGSILFQLLAPLQLAMLVFFAALSTASAVAHEKERKTLVLLLLTRLNNSELVLGKLMASLVNVLTMLLTGLPIFAFMLLFGGVSLQQILRVLAITLATSLVSGSLGSTIALWREKTFQTLALTALVIVVWLLLGEGLNGGAVGPELMGVDTGRWATWFSPWRAILAAVRPSADLDPQPWYQADTMRYVWFALTTAVVVNLIAIARVRVWNPSRELQPSESFTRADESDSIWGASRDGSGSSTGTSTDGHRQEANGPRPARRYRQVWKNPVLWREVCTWAYGRKMIAIRLSYLLLFALAWFGIVQSQAGSVASGAVDDGQVLTPAAWPLISFFIVSLVLVNALAVTSITNERDSRCLDLLLVTDLSPTEFLFGKLGGVAWVTKEMLLLPLVLCGFLAWTRSMEVQSLLYVAGGLAVLDLFVAMLGIHCGMTYANSRAAIGVSLGTVFFLFLGITTCIVMMISFSGSFQVQLAPFLAFILGGGVGLYLALGIRNPSPAIGWASFLLPLATFYAITSFLMEYTLAVFLVTAVAYSFTTAAMMIPALTEFDFARGRGEVADE
jgi:ABC-type transport system involved in multi-copper enzyme maturation permease subunit